MLDIRDVLRRFEAIQAGKVAEQDALLGRGGASSWEDYIKRTGNNAGRRSAVADLQELVKEILKGEYEDDE